MDPSPPIPPSPPPRPVKPAPGFGKAFLLSIIFYGVWGAASLALSGINAATGRPVDNALTFLLSQAIVWPLILCAGWQMTAWRWKDCFALKPFAVRILPALVLACFGLCIVLGYIMLLIPMPESVQAMFRTTFEGNPTVEFIAAVLVAPVAEELFFRGWMLRSFTARYSTRTAVLLTAAMFAIFHLNPWQAVIALPLGVLFAWLVLRTGSIFPGMIGHAVVNGSASFALLPLGKLMGHSEQQLETEFPHDMLWLGIVLATGGLALLAWQLRPSRAGVASVSISPQ